MKQGKKSKITSNELMDKEFEILQAIPRFEPPTDLYERIVAKTAENAMTISKKWILSAAAGLALLVCLETFLILQSTDMDSKTNQLENLVHKENYQFYE